MTYTFKLSRRLARLRHATVIAASLFTLSCTADEGPSGPGSIPLATDPTSVTISPDSASVGTSQIVQFVAVANGYAYGHHKVVSLALNPISSSVVPGGSRSFIATATLNDGTTATQPSLAWTATGGTVDSSGKYNAGTATGKYRVIATTINGVADTAVVTISAIAPVLVQIMLSPASVSLPAGGSQQFTVEGKAADSATVSVTPTYTATGGTISSAGLYTAGQTPGTYRVVATSTDGTIADSVAVVISGSTPPAPTPSNRVCGVVPIRLVSVSTQTQLAGAISAALPGDVIQMAPGTYGKNVLMRSGTSAAPITLCGPATAVMDANAIGGAFGLHLKGASYWRLIGFTVTDALKGIVMELANHNLLDSLTVFETGSAIMHIRKFSSWNTIAHSHLYRAGRTDYQGEGIYVGLSAASWPSYTGGQPDTTGHNTFRGNLIEDVTAEAIEFKEATRANVVDGNTIVRAGNQKNPTTGSIGAAGSIGTRGGSSTFTNNTIIGCSTTCPKHGIAIYAGGTAGDGDNNTFKDNTLDVRNTGYGIKFDDLAHQIGNVVGCDNTVTNADRGFANTSCQ